MDIGYSFEKDTFLVDCIIAALKKRFISVKGISERLVKIHFNA